LEKERSIGLLQRQTFQRAVKAGVTMVFGTDAGVYPHGDNAKQFTKMVQWGMTPMQAIQAATIIAAQVLGKNGSDIGQISKRKIADIIGLDNNPIDNVDRLEQVSFVMKGGKIIKNHDKL
jgi:imidazolonepropionase-like amidohydrolase